MRSDLSPKGPEQAFGGGSSLTLRVPPGPVAQSPAQDCGPSTRQAGLGSQNFAVSCEAGAWVSLFTLGDPVASA